MSIQFVIGNAGSGKSTFLYQTAIKEAALHPDKTYIIFVPDQFTMQTQKELVMLHPDHAIMNIEVLSFERFAFRVFDELGVKTYDVLEDTGKMLLLRNVASEKKQELTVLKPSIEKPGYISELKSLFSELKQYDISPEDFEQMIHSSGASLMFTQKGEDLLLLYREFLSEMEGRYITAEQILELLIDVINESAFPQNAVFFFDGYTGFTPLQNKLIAKMLLLTQKMYFAVTGDESVTVTGIYDETQLFTMSQQMMLSLTKMANESHCNIENSIYLNPADKKRFSTKSALFHLEQNLFRKEEKIFSKEQNEIEIYELTNPRLELRFVAAQIHELIRTKDLHYRDIAVICADLNEYSYYVQEIFPMYQVPYFMDQKTTISFHPCIEFLESAMDIVAHRFAYADVMHFLRTGYMDFTIADIDLLDHYLYTSGIRGITKYSSDFLVRPDGFDADQIILLNEIRSKLMFVFQPFYKVLSAKSFFMKDAIAAMYQLMLSCKIEEQLADKSKEFSLACNEVKAKEYESLYGKIIALLDKLYYLLGDREFDIHSFQEIFLTGMNELKVGVLPYSNDCIVVGDMERTRLEHIKVLFLMGANDGLLPKVYESGGVLSQMEREWLLSKDYEIAMTNRQKNFVQRFYIYLALTKPSEKLILTYSKLNNASESIRPSLFIAKIKQMYTNLHVVSFDEIPFLLAMVTVKSAREYLSNILRRYASQEEISHKDFLELQSCLFWVFEHDRKYVEDLMEAGFFEATTDSIRQSVLNVAHGTDLRISVSRLEQYISCAYSYFLQYELYLKEKKEHGLDACDIGNLYHNILKKFSDKVREQHLEWIELTDSQRNNLLDESVSEEYMKLTKAEVFELATEQYTLSKVKETMSRTVWGITNQIKRGKYIPNDFEVSIADVCEEDQIKWKILENVHLKLNGKIDRIDTYQEADKMYIRIIDYKSSNKKLNLSDVYHGLQLQLITYMDAALDLKNDQKKENVTKEILPGGMLYYHVFEPFLSKRKKEELITFSEDLLVELKMEGYVLDENENIEANDAFFLKDGKKASDIVNVKYNANGSLSKNSKTLSKAEFDVLLPFSHEKIKQEAAEIWKGNYPKNPYDNGKKPCTYCPYHAICGFDPMLNGYEYRKLEEIPQEDVISKMKEELVKQEG